MDNFSLLTERWIPIIRADGSQGKIAPVELADEVVCDVVAARGDFRGALFQFLIGLLQTTIAPRDEYEWRQIWEEGLSEEKIKSAFRKVEKAFLFGHGTPSFMLDFENFEGKSSPLAALLPESPGEQTVGLNKDLFIKRNTIENFCPHCAATALFSLQLNAPSGGKGYRTGLRGGGPLTTLVELHEYQGSTQIPLWRRLWVNVLPQDNESLSIPKEFDKSVFPWLGPTRTSETPDAITTPQLVNSLQCFWGMPRRIRIDFDVLSAGTCDVCGEHSESLLREMKVKNYGTNYQGWLHPLTPHKLKDNEGYLPLHLQPGGIVWKDWMGLVSENTSRGEKPAAVVAFYKGLFLDDVKAGLWGFGYDFDNMKVRCWYEHHIPQLLSDRIVPTLRRASEFASESLGKLSKSLKEAREGREESSVSTDFWNLTYRLFLAFVQGLDNELTEDEKKADFLSDSKKALFDEKLQQFEKDIVQFVLGYFDQKMLGGAAVSGDFKAVLTARKSLARGLWFSFKKQNS